MIEKLNIGSLSKHIETSFLTLNHKVERRSNEILCVVHRYIENQIIAFQRHCKKLAIDARNYDIDDLDIKIKIFCIEIGKAEFY